MPNQTQNELMITRTLNAPLERVWRAWTEQAEVQKWWGPYGVTNPTCEWDVRPGGKINVTMLAGDELGELAGQEWPMAGEFQEVVPKERLVYTSSPLINGAPIMDTLCTVTFTASGNKTELTFHTVVTRETADAAGPLAGMEMGWHQSLDKLTEYVEEKQ